MSDDTRTRGRRCFTWCQKNSLMSRDPAAATAHISERAIHSGFYSTAPSQPCILRQWPFEGVYENYYARRWHTEESNHYIGYEFPFTLLCLRNKGLIFHRFIDKVLDFCFAYVDDVILFSKFPAEHLDQRLAAMPLTSEEQSPSPSLATSCIVTLFLKLSYC